MADEGTPAERYALACRAYRKMVSDYRVALRDAVNFLHGIRFNWGKLVAPVEPRHGRPPIDAQNEEPGEEVVSFQERWEPERMIGPERLAEMIAALSAAWDRLNDLYAGLAPGARAESPSPADVHAAATAHTPFTEAD